MIVGAWQWMQYEDAFSQGLQSHGVEVISCPLKPFFDCFLGRQQLALPLPGPSLYRINKHVLIQAKVHQPDWVLFWRCTHILPSTIKHLARTGICTVSYNNDDPFGPKVHGNVPWHHHFLWHWYLKCLPEFDLNYFYRRVNCDESLAYGSKHAEVLMPYFLPWKDCPVTLDENELSTFGTDVVFVGHHEPDGREQSIRAMVDAGIKVKIWGPSSWNLAVMGDLYTQLAPIIPALGKDYAKALCGAKVCLAFLSKMNRDTYTRRCFEIPACGRVMLAERTDDLLAMFREDEEACFFSSNRELVEKVQWLLGNPEICERIAAAGLRRVWTDGHDVKSRAGQFIESLTNYLKSKS